MGTDPIIASQSDSRRYKAVIRISEAIAACRDPEELARTLADEISDFLHFDLLYVVVFKENSSEIEYLVWGKGSLPFPDLPIEEWPMWHAMASDDPQHTSDWDTEERFPRFKEWAQKMRLGSGVRVPLTTPHRRLGSFGIARDTVNPFSEEDICFLTLVGRVVAFAIDDGLNLRRAQSAHASLQSQNEHLQLLLNRNLSLNINAMPTPLASARPDGYADFHNQFFLDYTGLSGEQAQGSGWAVAVHPDEAEGLLEVWRSSLVSGAPLEAEARMRRFDGAYRWFLCRANPLRDEPGAIIKWYVHMVDIDDRKRAELALRAAMDERTRLAAFREEIGMALSRQEDLKGILHSCASAMVRHLDAAFARIWTLSRDRHELELQASAGMYTRLDGSHSRIPVGHLKIGLIAQERKPHFTNDVQNDPRVSDRDWARREKMISFAGYPLLLEDRLVGVMGMFSEKPLSESTFEALSLAAGIIAQGIERKRAEEALQNQNERLQLLLNLTNRITSSLQLRELLRAIAANIREVIRADAVDVALPDRASDKFRVFAMDFPHGKGVVKEELLVKPSAAVKKALETLKPVVVNTWESNDLASEASDILAAEGIKTFCNIPLANRGRALGILTILRTTETPFSPGDIDFLSRASGQIAIAIENALAYHEISELKDKLAQEKLYLEEEIRGEMNFENIVGNSPTLKHVLELVETVAPNDSTVLLLGETGTGKELIARAIHDRSRRKDRTFVKLNCAAIPTGLLESELFGHEKGAFTGAISQKIGRMELADQGTLFLDEVGDIPIEIQPKLLRALQEREFERLGSIHTRRVNIRLVAATNRDLEKMIAAREFRSDLYYRLHVFPIRIPPLRERKEDIPQLVSYFVQKFAKQMQKKIEAISPAVMKGLTAWEWPGNIRELENFIERAVIVTRGKSLEAPVGELRKTNTVAFPHAEQHHVEQVAGERTDSQPDITRVANEYERRQRDEIIRALTACNGRVGGADGAAARLGMNRTTFLSRMKKFGIYAKQYA